MNRMEDTGLTTYWTNDVMEQRKKEERASDEENLLEKQATYAQV